MIQKESLLVVDDNLINLKLIRILLEGEGYLVKTAIHADDAIAVLKTFHPRLILLDLQLPGMSGLELASKLKARPETKDIIIVALTAYAMKGDKAKALEAGCDGYVAKPIDTRLLPKMIAEYLSGKPNS